MDSNSSRARRKESYARLRETFNDCLDAFLQVCEMPGNAALNPIPDTRPARLLTGAALDYRIDFTRAVEYVLTDSAELSALFDLAAGESVPPEIEASVVRKCGRIFEIRDLQPKRYFKKFRPNSSQKGRV